MNATPHRITHEAVADILDEHGLFEVRGKGLTTIRCRCGARIPNRPGAITAHRADAVIVLVSPELTRLREQLDLARRGLAQAFWDGIDASLNNPPRTQITNPYLSKGEDVER